MKKENLLKFRCAAFLFFIVFILYFRTLNAPFLLDDLSRITSNPDIKNISLISEKLIFKYSGKKNSYKNDPSRPVVYFTYALNYWLSGLKTFSYHFVNLIIHYLNSLFVFFLLLKIYGFSTVKNEGTSIFVPMLCATLFAVHPVNTSCVSYVYNRADLLGTMFYVLSLLAFLGFVKNGKLLYLLSLCSFAFALFSKQYAVTLPAVVIALDYLIVSEYNWKEFRKRLVAHAGYWVMFILYLSFRYLYFGAIGDLEAHFAKPALNYLIFAPYAYFRYFVTFFIPWNICIDHNVKFENINQVFFVVSYVIIAGSVFFVLNCIYRKKNSMKIIIFFLIWFFITLSPTSTILPTTTYIADNRLYLSGIGLMGLIFHFGCKVEFQKSNRSKFIIILAMYCLIMFGIAANQNEKYRKPERLWSDVIRKYPTHARGHLNYGFELYGSENYKGALKEFELTKKLDPGKPLAYNNAGMVLIELGKPDLARFEFEKVIRLDKEFCLPYTNLGYLKYLKKEFEEAEKYYKKAIEIDSRKSVNYNNLSI